MATKKITDLVELISAASGDVLPIVDISDDITKKIQVSNFPISTATQTAIDAKQDTLVSGTNIKTINSTSLLGSGDVAVQETLVSGTNIKTLNSESLLGSGNIEITASPAGVSGAIQFSDGSAFASDAANLFWDDTNNRLGVGINTPTARLHIKGSGTTSATTALLVQNSSGTQNFKVADNGSVQIGTFNFVSSSVIENTTTRLVATTGGVAVNSNYAFANSSSILDVASTTKGFLPPRMTTTQKNAISSPASGLMVYDTTLNQMSYYNGTSWVNF
jgi:hypothetical protein